MLEIIFVDYYILSTFECRHNCLNLNSSNISFDSFWYNIGIFYYLFSRTCPTENLFCLYQH